LQYGCSRLARFSLPRIPPSSFQGAPGPSTHGPQEGHKTATRIRSGGCAVFLVRVTPSVDAMVKGAALLISSWPRGALAALDKRLGRETGVAVHVAEDLLGCVAVGGRRYLE